MNQSINQSINQYVFNVLGGNWDPTDKKPHSQPAFTTVTNCLSTAGMAQGFIGYWEQNLLETELNENRRIMQLAQQCPDQCL